MKQKEKGSSVQSQESFLSEQHDEKKQYEKPQEVMAETKKSIIPKKIVRIAPTGDVYITELEKKIIDTSDFQRLRGIRQLGNVLHVYPTALHTRFDHSLGTLAMADKMIQSIRTNAHNKGDEKNISYQQEVISRLYALLHDICHIPFGHTIEDELCLIIRHDKNPRRILRFLGPDSKIGKLIVENMGKDIYDRFMAIFIWEEGKKWEERMKGLEEQLTKEWDKLKAWSELKNDDAFIYDLVSNTVCADLLDYIMRDNYFCDLGCSIEYRFINFLYLRKMDGDDKRRVFVRLWKDNERIPRRDTLTDLTRLLEARYILAERVYFHHAKVISGAMLGRALQEMIISENVKEENLWDMTDEILLYTMKKDGPPLTKKLTEAFIERRLHKQFDHFNWDDFQSIQLHDHADSIEEKIHALYINPESRRSLEDQIADEIGAESGDVLIYAPPRDMNMKVAHTKVIWNGQPITLENVKDKLLKPRLSEIIDAHKALWRIYVIHKPDLSEKQMSLLKGACELYFKSSEKDKDFKEENYLRDAIIYGLKNYENLQSFSPPEYTRRIDRTIKYLRTLRTSGDKSKTFQDQMKSAIKTYFS